MSYRSDYRAGLAAERSCPSNTGGPAHHVSRMIAEAEAAREGLSVCEYRERLRQLEAARREDDE